jgi:hypothetical protein
VVAPILSSACDFKIKMFHPPTGRMKQIKKKEAKLFKKALLLTISKEIII